MLVNVLARIIGESLSPIILDTSNSDMGDLESNNVQCHFGVIQCAYYCTKSFWNHSVHLLYMYMAMYLVLLAVGKQNVKAH